MYRTIRLTHRGRLRAELAIPPGGDATLKVFYGQDNLCLEFTVSRGEAKLRAGEWRLLVQNRRHSYAVVDVTEPNMAPAHALPATRIPARW